MKESKDILAINLESAIKGLLKYWYLLAVSVLLVVGLMFVYLKYTSKTYRVGAAVLLQIDDKGQAPRGNNDLLRAFDFIQQEKSFQNEVFILQSLPLVREVVGEMDLRTSYFMQDNLIPSRFQFGLENIYKNTPILVIPEEGNSQPVDLLFQVEVIDDNRFYLWASGDEVELLDFNNERTTGYAHDFQMSGIYNFGETISNEYASFRVLLNANYQVENYLDKNLYFQFNNLDRLAGQFKGGLSADAQGLESTMAHIEFRSQNVRLGMDFLTKLIDTYIENNLEEANMLANKTIEHIERQLVDVSGDLNLSEWQLENLRSDRGVISVEDESQNINQQLRTLENRRDDVQRRLSYLRQMDGYFKQYKDSAKILAPSSLGLDDPILNSLIQELTNLNAEKQRIVSQDQMRNPRLTTLNIRIDNLKDVISENITFSLENTRNEIDDLDRRIENLNQEFAGLPGTQRELLGIERRFKLNDATYTSLLERRIHAQILKASKLPDAKVIEPPRYHGVASPRRTIMLALALFVGLVFPSSIIVGKDLILNRLKARDDVSMITNLPTVGYIPFDTSGETSVLNYPQSPMAESFYMLRSNLVYYLHGESNKIILVTSSIPGEGKSFSAYNLATSFAFSNSKTVLVEFDLRKPSEVMGGFSTNGLPGVSSYLINRASLEEITINTDAPNLDIIQAGQIPPNPFELLSSTKTRELMEELKQQYDFVILDTPPYGLLTDSFMLMNYADLNLFVTRLDYTKKNVFANSMEDLERKQIKNLYLLVNADKEEKMKYGYGKYPYMKREKKAPLLKKKS